MSRVFKKKHLGRTDTEEALCDTFEGRSLVRAMLRKIGPGYFGSA